MLRIATVFLTAVLLGGCGKGKPDTAGKPDGGDKTNPFGGRDPFAPPPLADQEYKVLAGKLPSGVLGVSFSPDGSAVAALDSEDNVRLWDVKGGKGEDIPPAGKPNSAKGTYGGRDIVFSPDGNLLCWPNTWDGVTVWDRAKKSRRHELKNAATLASGVRLAFTPDGRLATYGPVNGFVFGVLTWDAATGVSTGKLELPGDSAIHADGRTSSSINKDDGRSIDIQPLGGAGASVRVEWRDKGTNSSELPLPLHRYSDRAGTTFFASNKSTVKVYDLPSGRLRFTIPAPKEMFGNANNFGDAFAVSADGRRFAIPREDRIVVFDAVTGKELEHCSQMVMLNNVGSRTHALAFSPDGKWLATGWADGSVRLRKLK